jgi:hypothetical protein
MEDTDDWKVGIYPNPTMDEFVLNYDFAGSDEVVMNISSLTGAVVRQQVISNSKGSLKVDVSNLESGVYWVRLRDEEKVAVLRVAIAR